MLRPENRILKTAIEKVYSYTHSPMLLQELGRLQSLFEPIPAISDIDVDFTQVRVDRHMRHYENALDWAKLILQGNSPHCMRGHAEAVSLLFPMEAVFESFVSAWMRHSYSDRWQVKAQSRQYTLISYNSMSLFQLRPDIWLIPHDKKAFPQIICDMKWEIIETDAAGFNVAQRDLYQMLAYGVNYLQGQGDMLLIYPAHDGFMVPLRSPFEFKHNGGKALRLWIVPFVIGDSLQRSKVVAPVDISSTASLSAPFPIQ